MRVYVLISESVSLIGLYTSPVDAAEMQKCHPRSTVTVCRLNAEASECAASAVAYSHLAPQGHKS